MTCGNGPSSITVSTKGAYVWPYVLIKEMGSLPCEVGDGYATRKCEALISDQVVLGTFWLPPDTSSCQTVSKICHLRFVPQFILVFMRIDKQYKNQPVDVLTQWKLVFLRDRLGLIYIVSNENTLAVAYSPVDFVLTSGPICQQRAA